MLIGLITALTLGAAVAAKPKDGANPRHAAMMIGMFTQMDAKKDETVTQKEIHGYRMPWFGNGDINDDGKLSTVELGAMLATFRADHLKRQLVRMDNDADRDGAIKKAEIEKVGKRHAAHRQKQMSGHN